MMVGLPYSGKTTKALELSAKFGYPIVCPDAVRLALHGQRFVGDAEPMVWTIAKYMVKALFIAGHKVVILDATNTTRKRRDEWKSKSWARAFCTTNDAKVDDCIARAKENHDDEILPVIDRMVKEYEPITMDEAEVVWDPRIGIV